MGEAGHADLRRTRIKIPGWLKLRSALRHLTGGLVEKPVTLTYEGQGFKSWLKLRSALRHLMGEKCPRALDGRE
jgi:hypothetical protein